MSKMKMAGSLRYRLEYGVIRAMISTLNILPFRQRSAFMAWVMSRVIAPMVGYRKRIRNNLDLIWPNLGTAQRNTLTTDVTRNIGRTICELFSPQDLLSMAQQTELTGPGLVALEEARAANRPTIVRSFWQL